VKETPTPTRGKTKWDETPVRGSRDASAPIGTTPTPQGVFNMATPSPGVSITFLSQILHSGLTPLNNLTPDRLNLLKLDQAVHERNRPFTDDELDRMMPLDGYEIVRPPESYKPISTPTRKLLSTPTPYGQTPLYNIPDSSSKPYDIMSTPSHLGVSNMKPEDINYFQALLTDVDESKLSSEDLRDRKIITLLLKVKNGTPPIRKSALKQLTEKAREFGAGPLFNKILPLMCTPTLEDQERHQLAKAIDRVLFKLDELVRPYVHKILVAIEPMLLDESYVARVEGREIISNLAKAAGLATMISTMRPEIDHNDEYVRNSTAKAFAVVASALGIPSVVPFLRAVCQSKKSWQARHTGIKIVQQIAQMMGCAILPYLRSLIEIVENGLKDDQFKIRTMTALCLAALAEASYPYGVEAFSGVIKHIVEGIRVSKGKVLAAFFKAVGFIIPLFNAEQGARMTRLIMPVLRKNFDTPDDDMKKIILKVLKQCIGTEGIETSYVRTEILQDFLDCFWIRRMALDRKNYRQLIETTVEIATKIGGAEVVESIINFMKDESEPFRRMTIETIEKIVTSLGVADMGTRLEQVLIDGLLYCIQEQTGDDIHNILINGFGAITNALGLRMKPYIPPICGTVLWRLTGKNAKVRQQSAELIARIAPVMKICGEEGLMGKLGVVLNESLGEEYPEVLASVLSALKAVIGVIGMNKMTPPIRDLLPRLTPILKNRHEKVQENCIDLVGKIAEKGASFVSAKEWMRICFDLLELLKATRKSIRRACVNTFGYIAKAIGPQDVLVTLLNNLKVQERQNRVCTTVAIAIVSETCGPYTVVPALMNEYRVPELNVQNGVLKSFSFLFEYVGEMSKDYIYSVLPLLEDALTDRDLVHRQTASAAIKHLALGVTGLGCEDALVHLLNFVWPNVFETSPHVINAVMEAIEGLRVGLGVNRLLTYVLQGLFHPARRVRDVYWKIFNMLYVGGADDLVAGYPQLPDEKDQYYRRTELELFI
jgi:splicing factor 3B subunit 1